MELPVIGTRQGGHLDFMNDENSSLIDVDEFALFTQLQEAMRNCYEQKESILNKAAAGRSSIIHHDAESRSVIRALEKLSIEV